MPDIRIKSLDEKELGAYYAAPASQRGSGIIVIQEILQDKIYLDTSGEVQMRGLSASDVARRAMLGDISSDLGSE